MRRIQLLICLLLLLPASGRTQEFPIRNYKMQDGLAHDNVFCAMQDRRGFLCFATNYGLSIFDGRSFQNYTTKDGLTENCIISVSEDEQGSKLMSTYGGGVCVMTEDGHISPLKLRSGKIPDNVIAAEKWKDYIWIIGLDTAGYRLYRYKDGVVQKVNCVDDAGKEPYFLRAVHIGDDLLFVTSKGIYLPDQELKLHPFLQDIMPGNSYDICIDKSGRYWASTSDTLYCFDHQSTILRFPFRDRQKISRLFVDRQNRLWVCTVGAGLFMVENGAVSSLSSYLHLPKIILNSLVQDNEGSIWVATHGEGIYRLNSLNALRYAPQDKLVNAYCKALEPMNDSELLIGSIGTIGRWKMGTIQPFPTTHLNSADFIYFIRVVGRDVYYGTPVGLFKRSLQAPYKEQPIQCRRQNKGAISFFTDKKGNHWVGNFGGLYQLSGDSLLFVDNGKGNNRRINAISEDAEGILWLGTDIGLCRFNSTTHTYQKVDASPAIGRVNTLLADSRGRLWVGAMNGLFCVDHNAIRSYTTANGLIHNSCSALAIEDDQTLWIGTMNGLSYTGLDSIALKSYQADIYPNEVLSLYVAHGHVFAGLVNGLTVLLQRDAVSAPAPPKLYITAIRSGSQKLLPGRGLSLPYKNNKLSIEFIGISFRYADRVQYRYKILNLDESWHITTNNAIELPALPSGKYTLVLNARLTTGAWSSDLQLPISIATPFWLTWWFRLLAFVAVVLLVLIITRWRTLRRESRKREQLSVYNKIIYLKQQALSALINPHFIFNCMNSIQHFLNRNEKDTANNYLADFASLIRMTMEQAQEAFITIEQELSRINIYLSLEHLRFGDDLEYEISVDPALDKMATRIPNMMLQPYVENAIWHGIMPKKAPGKIEIHFLKLDEASMKIIIRDDGKGMAMTAAGELRKRKGYGHTLTKERLGLLSTLLDQYYNVEITPAYPGKVYPGVCVGITMPLYPRQELLAALEPE